MRHSLSIFALVAANLIPLFGVLFFDWNTSLVLALFWIENLIIGAFNLIKMVTVSVHGKRVNDLALCAFFVLHFGIFCAAHGVFLWDLLGFDDIDAGHFFANPEFGLFSLLFDGAAVFLSFIEMHGQLILIGISALVLSHLVSFIENFLLRGEIFELKAGTLMGQPYAQIVVMHAGLMLGALAIDKFGSTVWLLLVMVLFKLAVDVKLHLKRRKKYNENLTKAD